MTIGPAALPGEAVLPAAPQGMVVFAHGSGSSRLSPRNRQVALRLREAGLATLLLDLLTPDEAADRSCVFDVALLASRLGQALDAVRSNAEMACLRAGLFGASTGAAAALVLAAQRPSEVAAVVSRGGRPDLAFEWLGEVHAPTLLIVGALDLEVLRLNRFAFERLRGPRQLEIVPGASHLFEEPGTLAAAADQAAQWFGRHLGGR